MWIGCLRWLSTYLTVAVWIRPPRSPALIDASLQILYFSDFHIFLCPKWRLVRIAHASPFYGPSIRAFYWDYLNIAVENSKEHVFWPEMVCIWFHFITVRSWSISTSLSWEWSTFRKTEFCLTFTLSHSPAKESLPGYSRAKRKGKINKKYCHQRGTLWVPEKY